MESPALIMARILILMSSIIFMKNLILVTSIKGLEFMVTVVRKWMPQK
jgi:hypothetical protein